MADGKAAGGDKPIEQPFNRLTAPGHVEGQAAEQPGQRQLRVGIDERNMGVIYANAFRTNGTAEEVMLDFGLNVANAGAGQANQPDVVFQVNERVILNYYSAKRLAITLSQLIRRHEDQFGELELDVAKRAKPTK